jgi:hypothetical protein
LLLSVDATQSSFGRRRATRSLAMGNSAPSPPHEPLVAPVSGRRERPPVRLASLLQQNANTGVRTDKTAPSIPKSAAGELLLSVLETDTGEPLTSAPVLGPASQQHRLQHLEREGATSHFNFCNIKRQARVVGVQSYRKH